MGYGQVMDYYVRREDSKPVTVGAADAQQVGNLKLGFYLFNVYHSLTFFQTN